ncbi:putative T6SS immunity periplasmic lipoprotein [Erwinia billingiae]|uniref:putative T6SS immunity periplasmic lipoprotein n=1 Tax=Erwinia billingiae TaxID=182337 RepID=UPI0012FED8C6|nr:putative T6SS immunity periplasmic lipoprotein [Erwinia billingiae]
MRNLSLKNSVIILMLSGSSFVLTGCPGIGDRGRHDETIPAVRNGKDICFPVTHSKGYVPTYLSINLRDTPPKAQRNRIVGDINFLNDKLCLSPAEFEPAENKEYIVKFILKKTTGDDSIRSFVVGVKVSGGHVEGFPLNESEISRMQKTND